MVERPIESLQESIPLLGFGAMRLPKNQQGDVDFQKSTELITHAFAKGIRYFDTSTMYCNKDSEKALKYALGSYPRESYYITDKLSMHLFNTKEEMHQLFEYQLEACGVDYFDFYLAHALNATNYKKFQQFGGYEFLREMQQQGKIKHLGFSFHDTPEVLRKILSDYPWEFAQIQLNYLDADGMHASELYNIIEQANLPCIVMEPVKGGRLSQFPEEMEQILTQVEPNWSISSWAIRWVANHPNVKLLLSGMSTIQQVDDNVHSIETLRPFDPKQVQALAQIVDAINERKPVACTGCGYCMDCPHGVDIPDCFEVFSDYKIWNDAKKFKTSYQNLLKAKASGDFCISCGACMKKCPQHIAIPSKLGEMVASFEKISK